MNQNEFYTRDKILDIILLLLLLLKLYDKLTVEGQTPTSGAAYYNKINEWLCEHDEQGHKKW